MDIYLLDELLRRTEVIDQYESFVWTERYSAYGDFELVTRSDQGMRNLLRAGTRLVIPKQSKRVMTVETVENTIDGEGNATLKVSGRSLEAILEERANQNQTIATGVTPEVQEITGYPAGIASSFFDDYCRTNVDVPEDNIPFLGFGNLYPPGTISEPNEIISFRYEMDTIYNTIKKICDVYDLGFRLIWEEFPNGAESKLYFDVYTGHDRTSVQTSNDAVMFSPGLDNLSNTTELTSTAQMKNVAYVFGKTASLMVYADGVDPTVDGFERRVLVVKATDIDLPTGPELTAALEQKGKEELASYRVVVAFDGEIPQFGSYEYDVDYSLGDLVEQRSADGTTTYMLVTEQIFMSDGEGERAYPTLLMHTLIMPGTWLARGLGEVWDTADGYWEDA